MKVRPLPKMVTYGDSSSRRQNRTGEVRDQSVQFSQRYGVCEGKTVSSRFGSLSFFERTDWFTGLSQKFLNCRTAKLLLLAGTDRLDKDLLIGQMQGSFF